MARYRVVKLFALAALWLAGGRLAGAQGGPESEGKGLMFEKAAPAFALRGTDGESLSLERLRGRILVVQFGTSW